VPASANEGPWARVANVNRYLRKDIRYVPSPLTVVQGMLELGQLTSNDFLIDLGSGDGRIPIEAARLGARARGIEIDPSLVKRSRHHAEVAGVASQVEFRQQDMFAADLSEATIVTLYLRDKVNASLQPKLQNELRPGTRIVSHSFCMVDWEPDVEIEVDTKLVLLWTVE